MTYEYNSNAHYALKI